MECRICLYGFLYYYLSRETILEDGDVVGISLLICTETTLYFCVGCELEVPFVSQKLFSVRTFFHSVLDSSYHYCYHTLSQLVDHAFECGFVRHSISYHFCYGTWSTSIAKVRNEKMLCRVQRLVLVHVRSKVTIHFVANRFLENL